MMNIQEFHINFDESRFADLKWMESYYSVSHDLNSLTRFFAI